MGKRSIIVLALGGLCASGCATSNELRKELTETPQVKIDRLEAELDAERARCDEVREENGRLAIDRVRLQTELAAIVRDRARLERTADEMRTALAESDRRKLEADRRLGELRRLLAQLKSMIDAGRLQVKIVDGRMVLALPSDILFASGSAELSPDGAQAIAEVTAGLLSIHERRFLVEGHTDNVPIRTARFPSNWELGAARAITIAKTMAAVGMSRERISAASFGEWRPVAGNDTGDGRAANRRIEIVVVPDLSMLPGFEELTRAVESP